MGPERVAAGLQPVGVHGAGSARDEVEEPGPGASVLVPGQIDHAGQLLRAAVLDADVVPQMLIHAQGRHAGEPGLLSRRCGQDRPDRGPHRLPRRAELAGQTGHRAVLTTDLMDRPTAGPGGQHRPWFGDGLVLLGEHLDRAGRLDAFPGPFPPAQLDRGTEARSVDQPDCSPAMARGDHPAPGAAHHGRRRLDRHRQHAAVVPVDPDHVQAIQTDQTVTVDAVGIVPVAGHDTARRLRHSRGPRRNRSLVTPDPEGLD